VFHDSSERLFVCFFAFSISSTTSSSFFELAVEGKAIFMLNRAWTTTSLLDKSKINRMLIKGDRSGDKACNGTNVCIGVLVRLAGLTMCIKGLIDGRGQQTTNWRFVWHCKQWKLNNQQFAQAEGLRARLTG
jgi:hypothetical protein